tara:strand:+ start:290 stop:1255 length:966 start_codon:yes stop_codon:yes gene_type:complete
MMKNGGIMKIKLIDLLEDESAAAKQAKAKGLKSKGFGNWADSSGKVVAQTKDDKLVMTKKAKDPEEKEKEKSSKKKSDEPKSDKKKSKGDEKPKSDKKKSKEKPKDDKKKAKEKPKGPTRRDGESTADYKKRVKKIKAGQKRKEKFDKQRKKDRAEKSEFDKVEVSDGGKPKPSKNNPYGKSDQGSTAVDATGEVPKYESQRKFSKEQTKKETDAEPVTVHDRGNGHFAGKNEKGDVQGFFGEDAEIKAALYSKGKPNDPDSIKTEKDRRKNRDYMNKQQFEKDGGGSAWDEMMDGETPSKSWWSDMLDNFEKSAAEQEIK